MLISCVNNNSRMGSSAKDIYSIIETLERSKIELFTSKLDSLKLKHNYFIWQWEWSYRVSERGQLKLQTPPLMALIDHHCWNSQLLCYCNEFDCNKFVMSAHPELIVVWFTIATLSLSLSFGDTHSSSSSSVFIWHFSKLKAIWLESFVDTSKEEKSHNSIYKRPIVHS